MLAKHKKKQCTALHCIYVVFLETQAQLGKKDHDLPRHRRSENAMLNYKPYDADESSLQMWEVGGRKRARHPYIPA